MKNEELPVTQRPPLGFIVEGLCEYYAYPSIIAKITGQRYLNIRIENARGCGGILNRLEEHLDDLVKIYHPFSIIVTIDLWEIIDEGRFRNCAELWSCLKKRVVNWLNSRCGSEKFYPLPNDIEVVIQIQSLESWLISDIDGLKKSQMFNIDDSLIWHNVDEEVPNPYEWIKTRRLTIFDVKNPKTAKTIVSFLTIPNMVNSSKSFSKFFREVVSKYKCWEKLISNC